MSGEQIGGRTRGHENAVFKTPLVMRCQAPGCAGVPGRYWVRGGQILTTREWLVCRRHIAWAVEECLTQSGVVTVRPYQPLSQDHNHRSDQESTPEDQQPPG